MTNSVAYRILGLPESASDADVKNAYFSLIRQHSPEKDPEQFMKIREAYEHLTSPVAAPDDPDLTGIPIPEDPEVRALFSITEQLTDNEQFGSAVSLLEGALQAHPNEPALLYMLAGCQYRLGHSQKAAKAAERLVRVVPESREAWVMYAHYLFARGWMSKAQPAFEKAFDLGERNRPFLADCYYTFRENGRMARVCEVCEEMISWNPFDDFEAVLIVNAWSDLASLHSRSDKELKTFLKNWVTFLKKHKKQIDDVNFGLNVFYGLLGKENKDESLSLERVRIIENAAAEASSLHPEWKDEFVTFLDVLNNYMLWADPRNLSEYWPRLVEAVCMDTDERRNDPGLRRFSQLDVQLCMFRERDRILSEINVIRKDYPFVYERHQEFLEQLRSSDQEKLFKKIKWEFDKLSRGYGGSYYNELIGIPDPLEKSIPSVQPDFAVFPSLADNNFPFPSLSSEAPFVREKQKISRNDPCPCGSGKKFKHCCLGKGIYD